MKTAHMLLLLALVGPAITGVAAWGCHELPPPPPIIVDGHRPEPGDDVVLSGTVALSVGVDASKPVDQVELSIDGSVAATFTAAPYEYKWDTTKVTDGVHTITAKSTVGGKELTSEVVVTVKNAKSAATE